VCSLGWWRSGNWPLSYLKFRPVNSEDEILPRHQRWLLYHSLALGTRKHYISALRQIVKWQSATKIAILPPWKAADWRAYQAHAQLRLSAPSIRQHLIALRRFHRDHKFDVTHVGDWLSAQTAKAHQKIFPRARRKYSPVVVSLFKKIIDFLDTQPSREAATTRLSLQLAWFGVLRPAEYGSQRMRKTRSSRTLKIHHLHWDLDKDGHINRWGLLLPGAKNDPLNKGRWIYRDRADSPPRWADVCLSLEEMLVSRYGSLAEARLHPHAYLLAPAPHTCLTVRRIVRVFRNVLALLGIDPLLFSLYSVRKGATTNLHANGMLVDEIKGIGGWASNAVFEYLVENAVWQRSRSRAFWKDLRPVLDSLPEPAEGYVDASHRDVKRRKRSIAKLKKQRAMSQRKLDKAVEKQIRTGTKAPRHLRRKKPKRFAEV
jgi:hypothetical protein